MSHLWSTDEAPGGFEPQMPFLGHTRLAGERVRPLGQLFVTAVLAVTKLVGWNKGKGMRAARAVMPKRLG